MIEYRFRVPSAAVFTLYLYSKALEYRFRVSAVGSLTNGGEKNAGARFQARQDRQMRSQLRSCLAHVLKV
jgi:hypothetical protein